MTSGELLPDQPVPLLNSRKELTREQAIALWRQKRQEGWRACAPQGICRHRLWREEKQPKPSTLLPLCSPGQCV